jgi:hypothetical protein
MLIYEITWAGTKSAVSNAASAWKSQAAAVGRGLGGIAAQGINDALGTTIGQNPYAGGTASQKASAMAAPLVKDQAETNARQWENAVGQAMKRENVLTLSGLSQTSIQTLKQNLLQQVHSNLLQRMLGNDYNKLATISDDPAVKQQAQVIVKTITDAVNTLTGSVSAAAQQPVAQKPATPNYASGVGPGVTPQMSVVPSAATGTSAVKPSVAPAKKLQPISIGGQRIAPNDPAYSGIMKNAQVAEAFDRFAVPAATRKIWADTWQKLSQATYNAMNLIQFNQEKLTNKRSTLSSRPAPVIIQNKNGRYQIGRTVIDPAVSNNMDNFQTLIKSEILSNGQLPKITVTPAGQIVIGQYALDETDPAEKELIDIIEKEMGITP